MKLFVFLFILISIFQWSSCTTKPSTNETVETDTRNIVKDSLANVDPMVASNPFNEEKASILKSRIDQESDPGKKLRLTLDYGLELLKCGRTEEAIGIYTGFLNYVEQNKIALDPNTRQSIYSVMGIAFLRHGEIENCVRTHNHESCYLPIKGGGIHKLPYGSSNAIIQYENYLKEKPDDLEIRYLLNIAYMTLGQFPEKVPKQFRIDPKWIQSKITIQPFADVAPALGINRTNLAGGVVVDDFTNDGWLDIVVTSWSPREELAFYVNNGNGTFTDQTVSYGLKGQVAILNLNQTDFNNDGWLDLYLMRGAWWGPEGNIPNTLLMNKGDGSFEDVTIKYGLTHNAPTQTSAWADFNLDGWLDLLVPNESEPGLNNGIDLYINQEGKSFRHASVEWGLNMHHFFKGCTAFDADNDRYPDIYLSSATSKNILAINESGRGKNYFKTDELIGVGDPEQSFPCWSFDYNNDGHEDIFVSGYSNEGTPPTHWMTSKMGSPAKEYLPKLYNNHGNLSFKEVGYESGLTEVAFTMGCNFGDINTDGYLDFFLGTGNPHYQSIVPNKMYLNIDGKRFEDVSYSGGFANIQKGHGIGFGDLDHDGDEDIYLVAGGAFLGDGFYNCLYENPNEEKNNWIVLKLTGTTSNKAAIGARVALSIQENNQERKIFRTVTSGASFGANSLLLEIGLRKANKINEVTIQWPCKNCTDQVVTGLQINKAYELTQGETSPKEISYIAVPFASGNDHPDVHH